MKDDSFARILVVEDEAGPRLHLKKTLEGQGYQTYLAGDGQEALEVYSRYVPDAIVCDIELPDMLGYDILKTIRNQEPGKRSVFLFLSGRNSLSQIREGMRQGADDYLTKPIDHQELLETLDYRLNRFNQIFSEMEASQSAYIKLAEDLKQENQELIAEVHHRVKNNLQIILSLMQLQSRYLNPKTDPLALLEETQQRVYVISLVEKALFEASAPPWVELSQIAKNIVVHFQGDPFFRSSGASLTFAGQPALVHLDQCFPASILLSELLCLLMKGGYTEYSSAHFIKSSVRSEPQGQTVLTLEHNGQPFSVEDLPASEHFGKKLIDTMLSQLGGQMKETHGETHQYQITFEGRR